MGSPGNGLIPRSSTGHCFSQSGPEALKRKTWAGQTLKKARALHTALPASVLPLGTPQGHLDQKAGNSASGPLTCYHAAPPGGGFSDRAQAGPGCRQGSYFP